MKRLIFSILLLSIFLLPSNVLAKVYNGYWHDKHNFNATYPIVDIQDKKIQGKINEKIQTLLQENANKINDGNYTEGNMTYYTKYEDDNIVNFMFYLNTVDSMDKEQLSGFTVTYDKHTGEKVPASRYLLITLPQLQDALNHSKAYAVDGLDNGVNLAKKIPYVSDNYFIVTDGSVGLLYQPGDLMNASDGATKIIIAPEKVMETYRLNNKE